MLRFTVFLLCCFALVFRAGAQDAPPRHATVLDLTGATSSELHYASAAGWRLWGLDRGGRFQVGLGARASYFWGPTADFGNQNDAARPDRLVVPQPRLLALNLAFHLRARVAGPVGVGFNLDFLGASFGPDRPADFGPTSSLAATTRPVRFNLLQGGLPDRGSLNSELYLRVALPHRLSLRGSYSHLVTAYAVDDTRYRQFRNLLGLGVSYELP